MLEFQFELQPVYVRQSLIQRGGAKRHKQMPFRQAGWVLDEAHVRLQVELIERVCLLRDRAAFLLRLFESNPAILRRLAPSSDAIIFALSTATRS